MQKPDYSVPVIGVDTGGTFTDFVLVEGGVVRTWKIPSTPDDPSRAVLEGIKHLLEDRSAIVFHGSTVATNALLEGKGARVVLVTTAGFRDVLHLGRQSRPHLYALHPRRDKPPVSRDNTIEVVERILCDGTVEESLTESAVRRIVNTVKAMEGESIAICLLHSYANPVHEILLARALRAEGVKVSESSMILPEYREFERTSTTVLNAAVSPVMGRYLSRLQQGLGDKVLRIMQSNGGAISAATAGEQGVRTILSGPAGGMVGAFTLARTAGIDRILTFDMGGTSTDVGLCQGTIPFSSETLIAGWPVKIPMLDLHTVGAGGGSIARIDAAGALRVGPESAGADPGPACYGRGELVTVTDANLCLGRILPDRFLGGRMKLYSDRARRALEALALEAMLSPERLAEGIVEVAEATMAGALRVVSVARGQDPRDFVLLPFGGGGGLHACALAEELGIDRILIPTNPGLLSAVGLVMADIVRDYSLSVLKGAELSFEKLGSLYAPLREKARSEMASEGIGHATLSLHHTLDMRYRGQSFEVNVPFTENFRAVFHRRHEKLYGYQDEGRDLEIVTLRLRAVGQGPRPEFPKLHRRGELSPVAQSPVILDGRGRVCPVFQRETLPLDVKFAGPALIVEETATHLLRPDWVARGDDRGNLLLERQ